MITRTADLGKARRFEDADHRVWLKMAFAVGISQARRVTGLDADDIRGAAALGLAKAMRQFDPTRNVRPHTYAVGLVRLAVREFVRERDHVSRHRRQQLNAGAVPQPWEEGRPLSLDYIVVHDNDPLRAGETIEDDRPGPEVLALERVEHTALWSVVETLPEREQFVVERYYVHEEPFRVIGKALGVSESRVSQLHGQALKRLRSYLS